MRRNRIILFVVLACVAILLYILLPGGEKEKTIQPLVFNRTVKLVSPPAQIVRKGLGDREGRLLDRLRWGTSESINRTIDLLKEHPSPRVIAEAVKRVDKYRGNRPAMAKVYIDLLAEIKAPESLPTLLSCAADPSEMVRRAAIRGLSGFMDPRSTKGLVEQARGSEGRIRMLCLEGLTGRKGPEVFELYRDLIAENKDLRVTINAVEGLGNFDTPESRKLLEKCREDSRLDVRTAALKALVKLNAPQGIAALEKMFTSPGPIRRINGIKLLADARWLPSLLELKRLAADSVAEVRIYLTITLIAHLRRDKGEMRQRALFGLQLLMNDQRPDVRIKALEGLYKAGETRVALPYLRKLERARGSELGEAVELTASLLHCPQSVPLLISRFENDGSLAPDDRMTVLSGLADMKAAAALDLFFRVIDGAWNGRNVFVGEFSLARHAAFRVHALGKGVFEEWEDFLKREGDDRAAYLYINGVRNLGDPRSAKSLAVLAMDDKRPAWIRREAVKSFAFLKGEEAGRLLLKIQRESRDEEIRRLALDVFWNYF